MCHVIFAVAYYGSYSKTLDVVRAFFPVAVDNIVNGAFIVLLEYVGIEDILADKLLIRYRSDDVTSVPEENYDIIKVGTVGYEFIFLQTCADEALLAIDI